MLSHVWLFATPWTVACQAPLSIGYPRQEYWNGLPFLSPGNLPYPAIKTVTPTLAGEFWTTSLVAQTVKRLPTMQETWVQSLGQEDSLEKEMATHSSTLAWKIPWTEEPGRLQSVGSQRRGQDWVTSLSKYLISNFMLVAYWNCIYLANTVLLSIISNGLNVLSGKFKK